MKKFILFCFISALLFTCLSCTNSLGSRSIRIVIPVHPWEMQSTAKMWYTLKWTDGNEIKSKHISSDVRKVDITVTPGETVIVCAYPLDRLNPLGAVISPYDTRKTVTLDLTQGWFSGLFINIDRNVSAYINPEKLLAKALETTDDVRNLDSLALMKDILNGKLSDESFSCIKKTEAGPFFVPDGMWIAENTNDKSFNAVDNTSPLLSIPKGTYCWYCQKLELEIVVSWDGSSSPVFSTRRTKMT